MINQIIKPFAPGAGVAYTSRRHIHLDAEEQHTARWHGPEPTPIENAPIHRHLIGKKLHLKLEEINQTARRRV